MSYILLALGAFVLAIVIGAGFQLGKVVMLALLTEGLTGKRDETDGKNRSGLVLMRDHGTGHEYIMSPTGHLTPRLKGE